MSGLVQRTDTLLTGMGGEAVSDPFTLPAGLSLDGWIEAQKLARSTLDGTTVELLTRAELQQQGYWDKAFEGQRKDSRYYELVDETICPDFEFRYFMLKDSNGEVRTIQPFFIVEQDVLAGLGARAIAIAAVIRRYWPGFLRLRTLMVGCAAGEGHLNREHGLSHEVQARWLADALVAQARKLRARLIVFKEFPTSYRRTLSSLTDKGFTRLPSLPMTRLKLEHGSFDAYLEGALSKATRKNLRRKFKAAAQSSPIDMSVVHDISGIVDEIYPLYLQVFDRSKMHFEKLTKDYLCNLGRRMPDKVRFFVWRQNGKVVAFSLCMLDGDAIYDEYLGLDYTVALDLHLYHYTFRDIFGWAVQNGYRWYYSSALNYDPKLHLRCDLYPLDLYVRHTSSVVNRVMAIALTWLDPTRADRTLRRFPNYADLHGR